MVGVVTMTLTGRMRARSSAVAVLSLVVAGCTGGGHSPPANVAPTAGTEMSLITRFANFTVAHPKEAFAALNYPTKKLGGRRVQASISTPGQDYQGNAAHHIQGYAFYDRGSGREYQIFSANASANGFIYIARGTHGGTKITKFNVPDGLNHPAGMQIIGDYLLVGLEGKKDGKDVGEVVMYNLTSIYRDQNTENNTNSCCENGSGPPSDPITLITFDVEGKSSASAVGIANIYSGQYSTYDPFCNKGQTCTPGLRYILAVHNYAKREVTLAISKPGASLADATDTTFKKFTFNNGTGAIKMPQEHSYDGMALMSTPNNDLWMVGFHSSGSSYNDYADLFKLATVDAANHQVTIPTSFSSRTDRQHFQTAHSASIRQYGVHFRWGTSLNIYADDKLRLNVSEREFGVAGPAGGKVTVNWFFNYS